MDKTINVYDDGVLIFSGVIKGNLKIATSDNKQKSTEEKPPSDPIQPPP